MTLKEYNKNLDNLIAVMEHEINILSCGGEEANSVFDDIFRMFLKSSNEEFRSLVQHYSRSYDEGTTCEYH